MKILSHILGFPRIGLRRELKKAQESYWKGDINQEQLLKVGCTLRSRHWTEQKNSGLDFLTVGDFAWYDHVLTTSLMLNNIPERHRNNDDKIDIDTLFRVARGCALTGKSTYAAEMTKWFNTNYHYIVPEFTINQKFKFAWTQLLDEVDEALSLGHFPIKPVLLGPVSYLWLGKVRGQPFDRLSLLPAILPVYKHILNELLKRGVEWVQIDEPVLVLELPLSWRNAYFNVYQYLHGYTKILLTTYFDSIIHQIDIISSLPVQGLHVDFISGNDDIVTIHKSLPINWILSVGIINGRNIWRADLYKKFEQLLNIVNQREIYVGSSCSFLHVPIDLNSENKLDKEIKNCFSFAIQKCIELKLLSSALNKPNDKYLHNILIEYSKPIRKRFNSNIIHNQYVRDRLKKITDNDIQYRKMSYTNRAEIQNVRFNLPILPITTIGSFPQTIEIRNLRVDYKNGRINYNHYQQGIKKHIKRVIMEQEEIGLDVLVHGEAERNDMVEYFAEHLDGFVFTSNGWVQSYGSRCVKPPIVIGDISRPKEITVKWINYAQSLTEKPVKGILTGPVTILFWSFLREDISREIIARQIALSLRDEVIDLEKSGVGIIQIDEPALREGLPLKNSLQKNYLKWAVEAFRLITTVVKNDTQIHTHMCYCQFNDIINSIKELDVDVISIEAFRSNMKLLKIFKKYNFLNKIGPGIYDIHSPNVPVKKKIFLLLITAIKYISIDRLWVNPDCGLKTRSWTEIRESLINIVSVVKELRNKQDINKDNNE